MLLGFKIILTVVLIAILIGSFYYIVNDIKDCKRSLRMVLFLIALGSGVFGVGMVDFWIIWFA